MLIDSHVHLDSEKFSGDLDDMIAGAFEAGVGAMISPGTDLESSRRCIEIAEKYEKVYAAAGVHPHEAAKAGEGYVKALKKLCEDEKVVAVGEIGLDFHYDISPRDVQIRVLSEQISLAQELGLPVILHNRESDEELYAILSETGCTEGVVHCYTGGAEFALKLVGMGFYIGFTGFITFGGEEVAEAVKSVPQERMLLETDAPYMAPPPHRGKRNEPAYVRHVAERAAVIRGVSVEDIARTTTGNCRRLFGRMG